MNKMKALLYGIVLAAILIRVAFAENYKGFAHVCTTGKVCSSEMPSIKAADGAYLTTGTNTATLSSASLSSEPTIHAPGGTLYGVNGIAFVTGTNTSTNTMTGTLSGSATATVTATLPTTQTASFSATQTASNHYTGVNVPYTWTETSTSTSRGVEYTSTYSNTVTGTVTVTGSATVTQSGVSTGNITVTAVGTFTNTDSGTGTGSFSATKTATALATGTQTMQVTISQTATATATASGSATGIVGVTVTGTGTGVFSGSTFDLTGTLTATATATGTFTASGTGTGTATATASSSLTVTTTSTSYATTTSATVASSPTITYQAPPTTVTGGDVFLGFFNSYNIVTFGAYPPDTTDPEKTLTAGGAIQNVLPGDGAFQWNSCDGAGGVYCSIVASATSSPKWIHTGNAQFTVWAKSTSPVTLTMTIGIYNGTVFDTVLATVPFSVTSAAWESFSYTYAIPNGLKVPATPWSLSARFQAQDLASGTPTVTIGTSDPHRTKINGPWIASGAKP